MVTGKGILSAVLALTLAGAAASAQESRGRRPRAGNVQAAGPDVGDPAPDREISDLDGNPVDLSSLWAERPVILVFGSRSSRAFRDTLDELERLGLAFGVHAGAVAIYTGEDGDDGARTMEGRRKAARRMQEGRTLGTLTMLVDGLDDAAWKAYGGGGNPAFLVEAGFVVARQGTFDPEEMDRLVRHLLETPRAPSTKTPAGPGGGR
ncbi:MAG: hypothetical protein PVF68_01040 [Acidobacteriota bacterium]|jgi:hypothetical protein